MRSGDLHNCTQFDVILDGRARLVTYVSWSVICTAVTAQWPCDHEESCDACLVCCQDGLGMPGCLFLQDTVTKRETSVTYGRNDFIKIPARWVLLV